MSIFGPHYDRNIDEPALTDQRNKIKGFMLFHTTEWFTLAEISFLLKYPEASISAQLRHLRKPQFGRYEVLKRRRKDQRVWEYQIRPPVDHEAPAQMLLMADPQNAMKGH